MATQLVCAMTILTVTFFVCWWATTWYSGTFIKINGKGVVHKMESRMRQACMLGNRKYKQHSPEMLEVAVDLVKRQEISTLEAAKRFHRTIENKVKSKHNKKPGGQQRLSESEEQNIVNVLIAAGGSPLYRFDLSLVVLNYLKGNNKQHIFNNKPSGKWLSKNFLTRHKHKITTRAAQYIKKVRAAKTADEFNIYFENLRNTLQDILT